MDERCHGTDREHAERPLRDCPRRLRGERRWHCSCWRSSSSWRFLRRRELMHLNNSASTKNENNQTERYMENPRKRTTVATTASSAGLDLFDHQQQQAYALNTTSALVWQHCDGQTTPEQLMELLRKNFNVSCAEAEQLTW